MTNGRHKNKETKESTNSTNQAADTKKKVVVGEKWLKMLATAVSLFKYILYFLNMSDFIMQVIVSTIKLVLTDIGQIFRMYKYLYISFSFMIAVPIKNN